MTTKNTFITILIIVIVGLGIWSYANKKQSDTQVSQNTTNSIEGCYVATLGRDVYTLNVTNESEGVVEGMLRYKNFEKDSSSGTFTGVFENGILFGDYAFASEGMDSISEVVFKQVPTGFVQGFGDITTQGNRVSFVDRSTVTYSSTPVFVKQASCVSGDVMGE